jgi:Mrp family chromosome partitioning ATPase
MPVISLSSPKGGAGKTTTAALVATVLADRGESVPIFDTQIVDREAFRAMFSFGGKSVSEAA